MTGEEGSESDGEKRVKSLKKEKREKRETTLGRQKWKKGGKKERI